MKDIAKENAELKRRADENLAQKISDIESGGAETIRQFINEAETYTAARIESIHESYRAKSDEFAANKKKFRNKIFHDIISPP